LLYKTRGSRVCCQTIKFYAASVMQTFWDGACQKCSSVY